MYILCNLNVSSAKMTRPEANSILEQLDSINNFNRDTLVIRDMDTIID